MALKDLQLAFSEAVYKERDELALPWIKNTAISGKSRFSVYHDNIFLALTQNLRHKYPVVERLTDSRFFTWMAHEYIMQYPSISGNLDDYGEQMAVFIRQFQPVRQLPYLPDIARLEWAWHEAFLAKEAGCLEGRVLSDIPHSQYVHMRFTLHPSVRLVASEYPVDAIWEMARGGYQGDYSPDFSSAGVSMLINRPESAVVMYTISPEEAMFLRVTAEGGSLYDAYEAVITMYSNFDLGAVLQSLMQKKVFSCQLTCSTDAES